MHFLVSTGAMIGRPNGRNIRLLDNLIPKLNCDGLEFMFYSNWYENPGEILNYLKTVSLPIPVVHCQKTVGELITEGKDTEAIRNFTVNADIAAGVGAKKMVLHLWNGVISDSNFNNNARMYGKLREIASNRGVDLLVENVLCNIATPMTRWLELRQMYPDIHFIFDTKMAVFHDELKLIYDKDYSWLFDEGHIKHFHVNDYGGGYMTWEDLRVLPVGAGKIDFKPFYRLINELKYDDTLTIEATAMQKDGSVNTDMLNKCIEDIKRGLEENK